MLPRDLPEAIGPALPPGGRGRGLVLHKLMEEILTGETSLATLQARAAELVATCDADTSRCDVAELAETVRRTLALPEVAALRDRLIPELAVHAAWAEADGDVLIHGIADALALDGAGGVEAVIDWKSDVNPAAETVAGYAQQVRAYMAATGARRGMIVFMTGGMAVEVAAQG